MKRLSIRFAEVFAPGPMTLWVHRRLGPGPSLVPDPAGREAPPLPAPVAGRGYAVIEVEFDGCCFVFASLAELALFREIMGRPLLPRPQTLDRAMVGRYANSHWLSRLPARAKPWRYRRRLAHYLDAIDADIHAALAE